MNFIIVKNDRKKEEKHPDYNMIAGEDRLGGVWLKEKNGRKFFSCSLNDEYTIKYVKSKPELLQQLSTTPILDSMEPEQEEIPF